MAATPALAALATTAVTAARVVPGSTRTERRAGLVAAVRLDRSEVGGLRPVERAHRLVQAREIHEHRRGPRVVAAVRLRPDRDGTIAGYEGIDELDRRFGDCLIDRHLPPPGTAAMNGSLGINAKRVRVASSGRVSRLQTSCTARLMRRMCEAAAS